MVDQGDPARDSLSLFQTDETESTHKTTNENDAKSIRNLSI